jgi:hypothetical protein
MELEQLVAITLDPVALATSAGLTLDHWQERVVRSTARQQLLNVHRQGGKTTACAVAALHQAVARPGSLTLCAAVALRQATELVRKVRGLMGALRLSETTQESVLSVELQNQSRILALPGSSEAGIRGYTADLVICDEAA